MPVINVEVGKDRKQLTWERVSVVSKVIFKRKCLKLYKITLFHKLNYLTLYFKWDIDDCLNTFSGKIAISYTLFFVQKHGLEMFTFQHTSMQVVMMLCIVIHTFRLRPKSENEWNS